MKILLQTFGELTTIDLYKILKLRAEVFVVEQECPYLDPDDLDQEAHHLMLIDEEDLNAYCRLIAPGIKYDQHVCISRVVSHPLVRRGGWGQLLMTKAIEFCRDIYPQFDIKISAQLYLKEFYESFGFVQVSEEYLEDNIPHIAMIKENKIDIIDTINPN